MQTQDTASPLAAPSPEHPRPVFGDIALTLGRPDRRTAINTQVRDLDALIDTIDRALAQPQQWLPAMRDDMERRRGEADRAITLLCDELADLDWADEEEHGDPSDWRVPKGGASLLPPDPAYAFCWPATPYGAPLADEEAAR